MSTVILDHDSTKNYPVLSKEIGLIATRLKSRL